MAVSVPRKKFKKTKKQGNEEKGFSSLDSYLYKLFSKIPVVLFLLLIIFSWSFSTTILSTSVVHVCVSSRKLNNIYCLTAGSQPAGNIDIPLPVINNSSTVPSESSDTKINSNIIQKESHFSAFASQDANFNPIESNLGVAKTPTVPSPVIPSTPSSVLQDSIEIEIPVVKNASEKTIGLLNGIKKADEYLSVLRSYTAKSKLSDCDGRGIYVYDPPEKFNKGLFGKCNEMLTWLDYCKYFINDAKGEPLPELGKGRYNTHQYSLELIFHSRILNHPCRVHNVEDAKLFYVPYYGGLDVLRL